MISLLKRLTIKSGIFVMSSLTLLCTLIVFLWPISREHFIKIVDADGQYGFINSDGRIVIEPQWEDVKYYEFSNATFPQVKKGNNWTFVDRYDNQISFPVWEAVDGFDEKT